MRILVVDDEPIFRDIVKDIIHSNFTTISVLEAHNGTEALSEFYKSSIDLIFMDIQLPTTNGLRLARQLKAINADVPIVILTNHDTLEYREAASECGVTGFISKASSMEKEIVEVIRLALMPTCLQ